MNNRNDLVKYSISERYTKDNLAKDFIFKPQTKEWFLTESQAKKEVDAYLNTVPEAILDALSYEGWSIEITDTNLESRFGFKYEIYGVTDEESKTIYVYAYPLAVKYALAHEIGHFVDSYLGNVSKMHDWKRISVLHENYPSNKELVTFYFTDKEENDKEYFANCFLLYINDKDLLKKVNKRAYQVMERICDNIEYIVELFQTQKFRLLNSCF